MSTPESPNFSVEPELSSANELSRELVPISGTEHGQLVALGLEQLPVLIQRAGSDGWRAFLNFFGASIENDNTREAYLRAVCDFLDGCAGSGIRTLEAIEPFMVGTYVAHLQKKKPEGLGLSKSSVKLKLAAVRKFFDYLVVNQVIPTNPALSVRGPKLKVRKGKTPILSLEEFEQLVGAIDRSTLVGKRDYAWIVTAFTSCTGPVSPCRPSIDTATSSAMKSVFFSRCLPRPRREACDL